MQPDNIALLKMESIIPNPNQPRKIFNDDSLNELATSIKEFGILNPILVRKKEDKYEIIAGERRYRAAKIAGLTEIPVIVKEIDENKIAELALIENIQRENITPIEEAKTYEEIMKSANITEEQFGAYIGKSQSAISNKLRLLKLPIEVQEALSNKKISEKHARSLLTVDDKEKQIKLLERIIRERLSVKDLDYIIRKQKEKKESDNMNNGNFFPNYNNQEANNNISLNQMNMQATGAPMPPQPEPVVTANEPVATEPVNMQPLPQVEIQNMEPVAAPEPAMPDISAPPVSPIPEFGVNNVTPEPILPESAPVPPVVPEAPVGNIDIPLFNETVSPTPVPEPAIVPEAPPAPEPTPVAAPVAEVPEPVVAPSIEPAIAPEPPLFNQELSAPAADPSLNESFYEVPVNVSPVIEEPQTDNFTIVQQLLSSNNIEYKAYSNENGHCIIIEL